MARTKIDDLAHDAEELGAAEQKEVKGGAMPVVNATAVAGGAVAAGGAVMASMAVGALLKRKAAIPDTAAGGGQLSSSNENPLYVNAQIANENLFKKPGS